MHHHVVVVVVVVVQYVSSPLLQVYPKITIYEHIADYVVMYRSYYVTYSP